MGTGKTVNLPARLEGTCRRFDRWRQTRKGRSRIPEALWASAVQAAGRYGVNKTAQALRVDYYALKKRAEAAGFLSPPPLQRISDGKAMSADEPALATFVELAPPASGGWVECILELEDACGAKMRVHLKGGQAPDVAALSRSFWGVGA